MPLSWQRLVILKMASHPKRGRSREETAGDIVIRPGFHWRDYPKFERVLLDHIQAYFDLSTPQAQTYRLHRQGSTSFVGFGSDTNSSSDDNLSGTTSVDNGNWFYTAIVYENGTKRIYVDGNEDVSQGYPGPLRETDAPMWVGNNAETQSRFFHGRIDEVRISSVGRSAEWMELQNRSMRDDGFISVGNEELCR